MGDNSYKVFLLDTNSGNYHLIFNNWNNGQQLPDYDIVANRDYFFVITSSQVTQFEVDLDAVELIVDATPAIVLRGNVVSYPGAITVYNTSGQMICSGKDNVNLQHLSRGIYIVRGSNGGHVQTIKIAINQ